MVMISKNTVLCEEKPVVKMINPIPEGSKGLAASRWASPAEAPARPVISSSKTKVLCEEKPVVKMVNPIPEGWKGLAASRWASPKSPATMDHSIASCSNTEPPTRIIVSTSTTGVLRQEKPVVKMVNPIPEGCKGLAASRWATSKGQAAPPRVSRSTTKPPTRAIVSTSTTGVLCQEKPVVKMVNPIPEGCKGLAASRWA